jgi:hypothetical protein
VTLSPPRCGVAGRNSRGRRTEVSLSRARTGGKGAPHYSLLDNLTPVIFVATGEENIAGVLARVQKRRYERTGLTTITCLCTNRMLNLMESVVGDILLVTVTV